VKSRVIDALLKLDPRLLLGLMALVIGLTAFEGWLLVLRKPLAEYRGLVSTQQAMALALAAAPSQQGDLRQLDAEQRQVTARLTGQLRPPGSDAHVVSLVLAELDRSAGQQGITLAGIRPGPRREVLGFEEVSFDVAAKGAYLQLCKWLMDFERALGQSATVSDFTMKAAEDNKVALSLRVRLYRPLQLAENAK
jgi:Tfp pilus assembly protein PilO